jgi:hypothetical protein
MSMIPGRSYGAPGAPVKDSTVHTPVKAVSGTFRVGPAARRRCSRPLLGQPAEDPSRGITGGRGIEIRQDNHDGAGARVPFDDGVDPRGPARDAQTGGGVRQEDLPVPDRPARLRAIQMSGKLVAQGKNTKGRNLTVVEAPPHTDRQRSLKLRATLVLPGRWNLARPKRVSRLCLWFLVPLPSCSIKGAERTAFRE